jgi:predicted lipoprotein with Yx(FWY)xxD motif
MKTMIVLGAAALGLAIGLPATAQDDQVAKLEVEQDQPFGAYLTDAEGRALYMFTADEKGAAQSACEGECADAWPPLLTQGEPQLGEQVSEDLISTIEREDGATQVAYAGWPLYYFVKDQGPGEATGQDVHGFGGEWYLVAPSGEQIEAAE